MSYSSISPVDLNARLERGEQLVLIDVREPEEYELARIEGARLFPLSRMDDWAASLNPEDEIVVLCHHGIRSAHVCSWLARNGFPRIHNLSGGIDLWSRQIDPRVARY